MVTPIARPRQNRKQMPGSADAVLVDRFFILSMK
jgi:hypothetical protein